VVAGGLVDVRRRRSSRRVGVRGSSVTDSPAWLGWSDSAGADAGAVAVVEGASGWGTTWFLELRLELSVELGSVRAASGLA
jgi:hypothetical protein